MTNHAMRWPAGRSGVVDLKAGLAGAAGLLVMALTLLAGVAIALVFAATLAVIMALASVLLALSALAWRMRPRSVAQRSVSPRPRGGHAWVVYGLDGPRR